MYDRKAIRRRRAVLAVFVALSIAILTAYFGESGGGVFHTLQRGAQEAFAPIETGATKALKPVRDFFGWAGDTIDAKDQNEELKKEVQRLRTELAEAQTAVRDSGQLKAIAELHAENYFPQATRPVTARVIAKSPTVCHSSVKIDKGTSDGVRVDQPVIAAGGLVGKITSATGGTSEVRLLTDGQSGVSAQVFPGGVSGVVRPEVGDPDDLLLENVESSRRVTENTLVITSGFTSSRLESLFQRGIPIGRVSKVDFDELETYQRVHVKPFADFAAGFLLDLLTGATMGASSLVLTAVGYGVGRFKEVRDPSHGLLPIPVGAAATAAWVTAFAAVSLMLDIGARVSPLVLRDMVVTVLLNALLAFPVFAGIRRLLRPSLVVDPLEVRRRRQPPREAGPLGLRGMEV